MYVACLRGSSGDSRNIYRNSKRQGRMYCTYDHAGLGWRLCMVGLPRDGAREGNMFVNHHHHQRECRSPTTHDRDPLGRSEQNEHGSGDLLPG